MVAAKASPVTYVSCGDALTLAFLVSGDPGRSSRRPRVRSLSEAMARAGVPGRVEILPGKAHGLVGENNAKATAETFSNSFEAGHAEAPGADVVDDPPTLPLK